MNLGTLFHVVLFQPFFNALMALYHFLGQDMGVAIILLTLLIKLLLFGPSLSQLKAQRSLQQTQPKLKALKEQYKDNKEEYNRAVMRFYKENKVNPLSSCLPLLLQLPILIALYQVFILGLATDPKTGVLTAKALGNLYPPLQAMYTNTPVHTTLFGFLNLSQHGNIVLAVLAGAATLWQSLMLSRMQPPKSAATGTKDEAFSASLNRSTLYTMPIVTTLFAYRFPAGLALYWLVSTLFQVAQQYYFLRRHTDSNSKIVSLDNTTGGL